MIILVLNSCANMKDNSNQYERTLEFIVFKCDDLSNDCVDSKYSLIKSLKGNEFILTHANSIFFKGNDGVYDYLYEVFKSRYLLITPIKLPHNLSSTALANRGYVFVYDLKTSKSYHFEAKGFHISSYKPTYPLFASEVIEKSRKEGYTIYATINSIDDENRKVSLLMFDLKSKEVIELIPNDDNGSN